MAAEQKPDFSGEYKLNRQACTLSPQASAINTATLRFEHHEPLLRCEATFAAAEGEPVKFQFERALDGREITDEQGGTTTSSNMYWDESALVTMFRIEGPGFQMNMSWRYELLDGRRLRAVEQIRGGAGDQDNVWEFERQ